MRYFIIGITEMDNTGRVNIGSVLREKDEKEIGVSYLKDEDVLYLRLNDQAKDKDNRKLGPNFKWPSVKVDTKGRFFVPAWIRRFLKVKTFGITFDGQYLVLVPMNDLKGLEEKPKLKSKEKNLGLPADIFK